MSGNWKVKSINGSIANNFELDPKTGDLIRMFEAPRLAELNPGDCVLFICGAPGPDIGRGTVVSVTDEEIVVYDIDFKFEVTYQRRAGMVWLDKDRQSAHNTEVADRLHSPRSDRGNDKS